MPPQRYGNPTCERLTNTSSVRRQSRSRSGASVDGPALASPVVDPSRRGEGEVAPQPARGAKHSINIALRRFIRVLYEKTDRFAKAGFLNRVPPGMRAQNSHEPTPPANCARPAGLLSASTKRRRRYRDNVFNSTPPDPVHTRQGLIQVLAGWHPSMKVLRSVVCALVMMAADSGVSADEVEIVVLKHRTLDQVLPMLKPLVDSGGAVSGMESQIIIRTNARNLIQLKKVLASVDVPQRRLTISVRQTRDFVAAREGLDVGVATGSAHARVYSSRSAADEVVTQQVQTIDGKSAFIAIGQSVPFQTQSVVPTPAGYGVAESTMIRTVSTGFSVMPRVLGDRVTLDIHPRRATLGGSTPASVESQHVASTVTGRLGEWMRLGGTATGADRGRVLSSASASRDEQRTVWVKVDEVP